MITTRILNGLEACTATGEAARRAARMGVLEWMMAQPETISADDAVQAAQDAAALDPQSPAACAFVAYLGQAGQGQTHRAARRRADNVH